MPKFFVTVDRTTEYEVEADSARDAVDIVFDGNEDFFREVDCTTTGHQVYDEDGNYAEEESDEEEDAEEQE